MCSDDSPDFEKPLQVVDLAECHANEQEAFKYGPPHHSGVGVVIDCRGGVGQSVTGLKGSWEYQTTVEPLYKGHSE